MSRFSQKIEGAAFAIISVGLVFIMMNCASNSYQSADRADDRSADRKLADADIETLKDLWLKSGNLKDRNKIVQEFQKRKSVDGLQFCLLWTTLAHSKGAMDGLQNHAGKKACRH